VSGPRREISAYFVHEADARRATAALDSLFQTLAPEQDPLDPERCLLTIVLPTEPSVATLFVDARLLVKVEQLVERHGGAVWENTIDESTGTDSTATEHDPEDEPGPEVVEEMLRRMATPRSQWVTSTTKDLMAAVERERLAQRQGRDVAGEDSQGTEPPDGSER
jgi:hypothetical protein